MPGATVITGGTYLLELSSGYDSSAFVLDDSALDGPNVLDGDGGGNAYTGDKDLGVKVPASGNILMPSMPSPSAPMAGGGGGGGGGSQGPGFAPVNGPIGYVGGIQDRIANRPDVTINVAGGISTAAEIGKSVVDALTQYTQVYGPLNLAIR